jgi:predicted nucleotidyltransferase
VPVTFHSSADWDYEHLFRMKEELERLFERPMDLVQGQHIENSDTSIRRTHILTNLETVSMA